ncbi:MAG TPA: hypothetical protein VEW05_02315 [Candidatus Polarisedimenticolia bacterium]|nr:hypothetical protein [Candidatus Polarisedimenticolia bacterium]
MKKTKPTIEEVLQFLREADAKDWYEVAEYVRKQNPIRDVQHAALLRVGDKVAFQWPQSAGCDERFTGNVTRIDRRRGRLHLLADFGDGRLTPCGLPATMVIKQ